MSYSDTWWNDTTHKIDNGFFWRKNFQRNYCKTENMNLPDQLDLKQERSLINTGTKTALDKLALHNLKEAVAYANQCSRGSLEQPELISLCWTAVRQAAENYRIKKSKGIRFFAFCKPYIRGQINLERKQKIVVRNVELSQFMLSDENTEGVIGPDFSNLETKELLSGLKPAIFEQLTDRERAIIILRYESGFSFTEIGERIGFSRQSIQKSHAKALKKLRSALEQKRTQLL